MIYLWGSTVNFFHFSLDEKFTGVPFTSGNVSVLPFLSRLKSFPNHLSKMLEAARHILFLHNVVIFHTGAKKLVSTATFLSYKAKGQRSHQTEY